MSAMCLPILCTEFRVIKGPFVIGFGLSCKLSCQELAAWHEVKVQATSSWV